MKRHIFASRDVYEKMKRAKQDHIEVYSFFPVDRASCSCQTMIEEWKDKLQVMNEESRNKIISATKFLECPKSKVGMKRYEIACARCGQVQGYCWASNAKLEDWFDFHYVQWTDGNEWFGNLTPNISPISEFLGLECTCGQDTRDFRANQTLSLRRSVQIEESNKEGREFNKKGSKFTVTEVKGKMKVRYDIGTLPKAPILDAREIK